MTRVRDSDDKLLERLRAVAVRVDPVPERMLEAARASYAWRTIDAELAELVYDSAVERPLLAVVRSRETPRALTFSAPECGLTIELEVTPVASLVVNVLGQLVPPGHAVLEIRHGGGSQSVEAGELGRFAVEGVHAGPFSIRCTRAAANAVAVTTDWTML